MKNLLLLLIILVICTACAKGGKTSASLNVTTSGISISGVNLNHIIVTGTNGKQSFSKTISQTGSVSLNLDNGEWNFLALSWEGADAFTGKVRCAFQQNVTLNGKEASINLSMSNATCTNAVLSDTSFVQGTPPTASFKPDILQLCLNDISTLGSVDGCVVGSANAAAPFKSARYAILDTEANSQGTFSACTNLDSAIDRTINGRVNDTELPVLKSEFYFPIVVQAFQDTTCTSDALQAQSMRFVDNTTTKKLFTRFNDADICASLNATTITQIGHGTIDDSPYGICNLAQLKHLHQNFSTHTNKGFVLLADLDLNPWTKGGTGTAFHACLQTGSTFIPLGLDDCTDTVPLTFSGVFNGNDHTIRGFRYRAPEDPTVQGKIGFISEVNVSALVRNITFDQAQVSGLDYVGVAVGRGPGYITHVTVKRSEAEAETSNSYVGGVIGDNGGSGNILFSHVSETVVRGRSYLGGIAGGAASISNSSFDGNVLSEKQNCNTEYVGGIAGAASNPLSHVSSSGHIYGNMRVGGIVGQSTNTIAFARSTMAITGQCVPAPVYIGGISGEMDTGFRVENSYFAGSILQPCAGACNVGEISGYGTVASLQSAVLSNAQAASMSGIAGTVASSETSITAAMICSADPCPLTEWVIAANDMPRYEGEVHPCTQVANHKTIALQISPSGRGASAANPITLCNSAQVAELFTYPTAHANLEKHYTLLQDLLIPNGLTAGNFAGTLNGRKHMLHGFTVTGSTLSNEGSFKSISGTVQNLEFANIMLSASTSGSLLAIVTPVNTGTLNNIKIWSGEVIGTNDIGAIAGSNQGILSNASVRNVNVQGHYVTGGLVGYNEGPSASIFKSEFIGKLGLHPISLAAPIESTGGLVGMNEGSIATSSYAGSFDPAANWSGQVLLKFGFIVGENATGATVTDVLVNNDNSVTFPLEIEQIGGIAGYNGGSINRAVSYARVSLDSSHAGTDAGVFAGTGTNATNSFAINAFGQQHVNFTTNVFGSPLTGTSTCVSTGASWSPSTPPNGSYIFYEVGNPMQIFGSVSSGEVSFPVPLTACTSLSMESTIETIVSARQPLPGPITNLITTNGFSLWNATTDEAAIVSAHLSNLDGGTPTTQTWIYEDQELKLFSFDGK